MDKANLEEVKASLEETPEEETPSSLSNEEKPKEEEKKEELRIPKSRLDEVIAQRKELEEKVKDLERGTEFISQLKELGINPTDVLDYYKSSYSEEDMKKIKATRELEGLKKTVSSLKEEREIEGFLNSQPSASVFKTFLMDLKKANPQKTYSELYEGIQNGIKQQKKEAKVNLTANLSPEETFEDSTISSEQFKKLSLEKQKEYLQRFVK